MKNSQPRYQILNRSHRIKLCLHLLAALLLIIVPIVLARGQRPENATISSVSSHSNANGTVVQIAADSSLNRAQTFQDRDGFHIVIPDAGVSDLVKSRRGVRVRRVGTAIEVLLQTKQGTPITVQTIDNRINLTVEGRLDSSSAEGDSQVTQEQNQPQSTSSSNYSLPTDSSASQNYSGGSYPAETTSTTATQATDPAPAVPAAGNRAQVRNAGEYQSKEEGNVTDVAPEEDGVLASVFSGPCVAAILVLSVVALVVARKTRSKKIGKLTIVESDEFDTQNAGAESFDSADESSKSNESNDALIRSGRGDPSNGPGRERQGLVKPVSTAPPSLFGAYRIEQEVGKLVLGQAHRMDVLSSRASEDRRAIQASLIKTIVTAEYTEDERCRARCALEEYGFVARESAALLLAADAFERTSAARSLGEMGSAAALPFLLEALHDVESIVRNQAVVSIGELKVPSAIGALLDMARKHPDVPSSLVSRALSACSVDFFNALAPATAFLTSGVIETGLFDFMPIEPTSAVVGLPESVEDAGLCEALEKAFSENVEERTEAVKCLGQYSSKSAVSVLVSVIQKEPESTIRALAVSGLAFIDHESVFPAVLIGMADESREVRAAAARALSRSNFDRSEAYVYVLQTSDEEMLGKVAQACIKAGIASQNIDRLASGDRRQAYEAFALVSLLAKAKLIEPVLEAIQHHRDLRVRLSAVSLLAATGQTFVFEQLQQLAARDEIAEEVKTALLEGMYKLEQVRPKEEAPPDEFIIRERDEEFETDERMEDRSVFEFHERTEVDEVEL